MEHAKKFILVEPAKLNSIKTPHQTEDKRDKLLTKPVVKELMDLDADMEAILKDTSLSAEEKVKLYNQALAKYQSTHQKALAYPIKVDVVNENAAREEPTQRITDQMEKEVNNHSDDSSKHPAGKVLQEIKHTKMDGSSENIYHQQPYKRKRKQKRSLKDQLAYWEYY